MKNTDEKITGGLGIKENTSYDKVGYTSISQDLGENTDINIPNGHTVDEEAGEYRKFDNDRYHQPKKGKNKGLIIAISSVSIVVISASTFILSNMNKQDEVGPSIVKDNINISKEEDVEYSGSDKTTFKSKPKKADTTLTSDEKISIEELFTRFYNEHVYAVNSGDDSYIMNYLTNNGDYKVEYEKLMENHAKMYFELMELDVLSVIKQNNNTYMVTVKDKIKVDRPENLSIQACKTVYEVRQIDGEFLIHSIKSETTIKDESKILETKEIIEEPVIEEPSTEEPIIEEQTPYSE